MQFSGLTCRLPCTLAREKKERLVVLDLKVLAIKAKSRDTAAVYSD